MRRTLGIKDRGIEVGSGAENRETLALRRFEDLKRLRLKRQEKRK
jgi:hypothetical protein